MRDRSSTSIYSVSQETSRRAIKTQQERITMSQKLAICKTKEKESLKSQRINRFEELPDDILASILSYFSLRDAAHARLLSSRWRHLSASITNLNFDWYTMFRRNDDLTTDCDEDDSHHCEEYKDRFIQGVNQFLQYYMGSRLVSFSVSLCLDSNSTTDVDQWVSFAIDRGVEQLYLIFSCGKDVSGELVSYILRPQLLSHPNAAKLKTLHLNTCTLGPGPINQLSSLKNLQFVHTRLDEERLECILSSCLNLEDIRLAACIVPLKLCIPGSLKRLKHLAVLYCCKLEEIELAATDLTTFEYAGDMIKFSFSRVPNLEKVFFRALDGEGAQYVFGRLAKDLPLIKNLSIYSELNLIKHAPPEDMPTFNTVKVLELFCDQKDKLDILKWIIILRACPLLEKFNLMIGCPVCSGKGMGLPHKFVHKHLKEIQIGGFIFHKSHLWFAIYVLQHAAALEKMVITRRLKLCIGDDNWRCNSATWADLERYKVCKCLKPYSKGATIIVE